MTHILEESAIVSVRSDVNLARKPARRDRAATRLLALAWSVILWLSGAAAADTYTVTLDATVAQGPVTGRLMLFFVTETGRRWSRIAPSQAPFFESPQPIVGMDVTLEPGQSTSISGARPLGFPGPLDELSGSIRIQAVLDWQQTERSFLDEPGNLVSDVVSVEVDEAQPDETIRLTLDQRIPEPRALVERPNLKWVTLRSERLSEFYGRDVFHRAGVALPKGYLTDPPQMERWPVIVLIPDFSNRHQLAIDYAEMHAMTGTELDAPQAVYIVLDPESPLGHHGFVDSPNNGPRGTALIEEFIPHLEQRFNLAARPTGWLVTGYSSGGWSALWLQLHHPNVFGGCWSGAPDPVDFSAFQTSDLYNDRSLYFDPNGRPRPSYRRQIGPDQERVCMTVLQEMQMEHAMDPAGRSGQQWDSWEAMFSPRDANGLPRPLIRSRSGEIDQEVVSHWTAYDINRLLRERWDSWGPIMTDRVRLMCGSLDSYYLNQAVEKLKGTVEELASERVGPGYVELYPLATHNNLLNYIFDRWNQEMRAYFERAGLAAATK